MATPGLTGWEALAGHVGPAGCADSVSFRGGHFLLPCGQHLVERVPADGRPAAQKRREISKDQGTGDTNPSRGFLVAAVPTRSPQLPDHPCQGHIMASAFAGSTRGTEDKSGGR